MFDAAFAFEQHYVRSRHWSLQFDEEIWHLSMPAGAFKDQTPGGAKCVHVGEADDSMLLVQQAEGDRHADVVRQYCLLVGIQVGDSRVHGERIMCGPSPPWITDGRVFRDGPPR